MPTVIGEHAVPAAARVLSDRGTDVAQSVSGLGGGNATG
ncbi:Uncharacterised protein [Mycobacteroides abscessus subsp. abscessus]|nr:Uncharacterised protein [Mycobacteroides abscessus subsp. abscessus]